MTRAYARRPIINRLLDMTTFDPGSEYGGSLCRVWTGHVDRNGYARIARGGHRGGSVLVHRLAYAAYRGEIPWRFDIDHLCRNRICCNPDHLEAVTHAVNLGRGEHGGCVVRKKPRLEPVPWAPERRW